MELIYSNFDALDITFQGAFPEHILEKLSEAREKAQSEKREVLIHIGKEELPVMVAETGMRGGFRYRFDTGLDGEKWFVSHSTNTKNWNIRVSVKSLALALYGYEGAKSRLIKRLNDFEAKGQVRMLSAKEAVKTDFPLERISRFDFCFDFVMLAAFEPLPKRFVAHQRAKKHVYGEEGAISNYSSLNGDKINTIRIGEMPGRQVVIYNKTKEIISSSKSCWWKIWDIEQKAFKESFKQIWRIEVRAGKDELNKWSLKRFEDFDLKAGDVIQSILSAIRYTKPLKGDLNRSRWPNDPIWQAAIDNAYRALKPYSSNALRENIIKDYRENVIKGYEERILGNTIGLTAAKGLDISEIPIVIEALQRQVENLADEDLGAMIKKYQKAEEKFRFLI
jgi:hypothetical protein